MPPGYCNQSLNAIVALTEDDTHPPTLMRLRRDGAALGQYPRPAPGGAG
jgi:hypothetical protein